MNLGCKEFPFAKGVRRPYHRLPENVKEARGKAVPGPMKQAAWSAWVTVVITRQRN